MDNFSHGFWRRVLKYTEDVLKVESALTHTYEFKEYKS
jgi:hypothetical protein